jgi:hypothetical protein
MTVSRINHETLKLILVGFAFAMLMMIPAGAMPLGQEALPKLPLQQTAADRDGPVKYDIPETWWDKVLDWLKEELRLPYVGSAPTGILRLPPVYQLPANKCELIRLLDLGLKDQNAFIMVRPNVFLLWPCDVPVPDGLGVTIDLKALPEAYDRTRYRVEVDLKHLDAEEMAERLRPALSGQGKVIPDREKKRLTLVDDGAYLRKNVAWLTRADAVGKRYADSPTTWMKTFDWLSAQTSLPFVSKIMPTKPLQMPVPASSPVLDLGAVFDKLNAELASQNRVLLRGKRGLHLLVADEAIDPDLLPMLSMQELQERGKSEWVTAKVVLNGMKARDMVSVVAKHLSPSGYVESQLLNQLTIRDKAEYVRAALDALREVPEKGKR